MTLMAVQYALGGRTALLCTGSNGLGRACAQQQAQAQPQAGATIVSNLRGANPARRYDRSEEFGPTCAFPASARAGSITAPSVLLENGAYPGAF